ncbi:MAG TPA: lamin tail domain-containing protein, partial [Blastocatellia bacterium]
MPKRRMPVLLFLSLLVSCLIFPAPVLLKPAARVFRPKIKTVNTRTALVTGSLAINEYMADPPPGPVGDANGDGVRDAAQDEFIELVNTTAAPLDISGFTISDA